MIDERDIERYLFKKVKREKGMCIKLNPVGMSGLPDRVVLLPLGKIFFIELKAPKQKPRPLQEIFLRTLRELGFLTYVIDSKDKVDEVINFARML